MNESRLVDTLKSNIIKVKSDILLDLGGINVLMMPQEQCKAYMISVKATLNVLDSVVSEIEILEEENDR